MDDEKHDARERRAPTHSGQRVRGLQWKTPKPAPDLVARILRATNGRPADRDLSWYAETAEKIWSDMFCRYAECGRTMRDPGGSR